MNEPLRLSEAKNYTLSKDGTLCFGITKDKFIQEKNDQLLDLALHLRELHFAITYYTPSIAFSVNQNEHGKETDTAKLSPISLSPYEEPEFKKLIHRLKELSQELSSIYKDISEHSSEIKLSLKLFPSDWHGHPYSADEHLYGKDVEDGMD